MSSTFEKSYRLGYFVKPPRRGCARLCAISHLAVRLCEIMCESLSSVPGDHPEHCSSTHGQLDNKKTRTGVARCALRHAPLPESWTGDADPEDDNLFHDAFDGHFFRRGRVGRPRDCGGICRV